MVQSNQREASSEPRRPFHEWLRDRRHELGLSQGKVLVRTRIKQPTYSAWENGRRLPDTRDSDFRDTMLKLATVLKVKTETLIKKVEQQRWENQSSAGESTQTGIGVYLQEEKAYLHHVKNVVDNKRSGSAGEPDMGEIWVLGGDALPVADHVEIKNRWQENLRHGVNYKIVWALDTINSTRFRRFLPKILEAFTEIGNGLDGVNSGRVYHYPVLISPSQEPSHTLEIFDAFRTQVDDRFNMFLPMQDLSNSKLAGQLQQCPWCFVSMIVYTVGRMDNARGRHITNIAKTALVRPRASVGYVAWDPQYVPSFQLLPEESAAEPLRELVIDLENRFLEETTTTDPPPERTTDSTTTQ